MAEYAVKPTGLAGRDGLLRHATPSALRRPEEFALVTDLRALERLRPEWKALWQSAPFDYLMQDFDWTRITLENPPDPRPRRLACLTGRCDGRLTVIWPFSVCRQNGLRVATQIAAEWGDYTSPLVADGGDQVEKVARAWSALRALCGCDVFDLRFVRDSTPLSTVLRRDRSHKRILYKLEAPWTALRHIPDWDAYWETRDADHRRDYRRKQRRLAELGALRFEMAADVGQGEKLIDWIIAHKRIWLDHSGKEDKIRLLTAAYPQFLKAQVRAFLPAGRCIIFALKLDDRIIAADLASVDKSRLEWNVGTFDYEYRKYSPGNLLKEQQIRWALTRRLDFDMRLGDGQHKRLWGNRVEETYTYRCANSTLGLGYLAAKQAAAIGRAAAKGMREWRMQEPD